MAQGDVVSTNQSYQFPVTGDSTLYARFAQKYSGLPETISSHPVSYDSTYAALSISNLTNAYTDSSSNTYAQINLLSGEAAESYIFYNFDFSSIPSGATITSVTCTCKCSINYASSTNLIRYRNAQLYSGSTAKGSAYTIPINTTAFTITGGSWTRDELQNAKIRLYGQRGTMNTSYSLYFRFYGATVTVAYTLYNADFIVNSRSEVDGVRVYPDTQTVKSIIGNTITPTHSAFVLLSCTSMTGYTLLDNGESVGNRTRSLGNSAVCIPNGWEDDTSHSAFTVDSSNPITNAYKNSTSTSGYAQLSLDTKNSVHAGWLDFDLIDINQIPSWATINSITCNIRYAVSSTTYITAVSMQLYSGNTAKGTAQTSFSTTNAKTGGTSYSVTPGNWTLNELKNLRMHVQATKANYNDVTAYLYLYGADVTISYTANGLRYEIDDVTSDHTVVLKSL